MRHPSPRPRRARVRRGLVLAAALVAIGCGRDDLGGHAADAQVTVAVTPLDLPEVTDASFNLRVLDAGGDPVWERLDLRVSEFGAAGGLTYVGPCDATSNPNRVELELVELVGPTSADSWVNPAPPGAPIFQDVTCAPNADQPVVFDLTIARSAEQGFFDVGVDFSDVFCSAKLDCVDAEGDPLHLLHDPADGARKQTAVVALACTAGPDQSTEIYRGDLTIECPGRTYTVRPTAGLGNIGGQAPGLFQAAVYAGREQLPGVEKCYWNVALGLDLAGLGPGCTLHASATASADPLPGGRVPDGHVWPVIEWSAPLTDLEGALACGRSALDDSNGRVRTAYTPGTETAFARQLSCATADFDNPGAIACAGVVDVEGRADGQDVEVLTSESSVTVRVGDATSGPLALPEGLSVDDCCADPCCQ